MLTLAYDFYPTVPHLLGEAVAGWGVVGTFLILMALA